MIEYYGPGLDSLSGMDRHVIANMGAELGATTTVFPSDGEVRRFLEQEERGDDWVEIVAEADADYDIDEEIDLSSLEPLVAKPTSPGNVVPVREVAGTEIYQAYIGSSANPGLRDLAVPAMLLEGRRVAQGVSLDINPSSRETLQNLTQMGLLMPLLHSGARLHQAGCNGCIGMGQAPATGRPSLRTTPRNFPGRSGTKEDAVYLVSPETAVVSALTGVITDPRDGAEELGLTWPEFSEPTDYIVNRDMLVAPLDRDAAMKEELVKGPNVSSLPEFDPLPDAFDAPVLLKVGDNVSTDEIMPAGQKVLPYRSNIPKIAEFVYYQVDETYVERAKASEDRGHVIVGGDNYGQGSSREHAAIAPRYLGLRVVIAKSYARIHWQNLANFGILGLEFDDPADYES